MEICGESAVPIFLVTNGVLLREKQSELLLHPAFRQICFSLHSFFDNFPEKDPTQYLERIFSFTERALERRPDLYLNFRLWNLDEPRGTGAKNQEMLAQDRGAIRDADLPRNRRQTGQKCAGSGAGSICTSIRNSPGPRWICPFRAIQGLVTGFRATSEFWLTERSCPAVSTKRAIFRSEM